jgi:hypothetical protein
MMHVLQTQPMFSPPVDVFHVSYSRTLDHSVELLQPFFNDRVLRPKSFRKRCDVGGKQQVLRQI